MAVTVKETIVETANSACAAKNKNENKRPSYERRWSTARRNQAASGLFDKMNAAVAVADRGKSSRENPPAAVPLIDISPFVVDDSGKDSDKDAQQAGVVEEVLSAATGPGFFKIVGHGVPESVVDDMIATSREFFRRSKDDKVKCLDPTDPLRGYFEKENVNATLGRNGQADVREGYNVGPSDDPDLYENLWPEEKESESSSNSIGEDEDDVHHRRSDNNPSFEDSARTYYDEMEKLEGTLNRILTRALASIKNSMSGDDNWLQLSTGRHRGLLRTLRYPSLGGCLAAHSDWSTIRILLPTEPGLEVVQENEWRMVSHNNCTGGEGSHNAFVVNIGDTLERWSNGSFKSSIHRVNCQTAVEGDSDGEGGSCNRQSIAYFAANVLDPTDRTVVEPIVGPEEDRAFEEDLSIFDYLTRNIAALHAEETNK